MPSRPMPGAFVYSSIMFAVRNFLLTILQTFLSKKLGILIAMISLLNKDLRVFSESSLETGDDDDEKGPSGSTLRT